MNLNQSLELANLRRGTGSDKRIGRMKKGAGTIAREVAARSDEVGINPDKWRRRWLGSKGFRLMSVPLNLLAIPTGTVSSDKAIGAMHAATQRVEDIGVVVDVNKQDIGQADDYRPKVVVVAGAIQASGAQLRGERNILAWVGDKAALYLDRLLADHQLGASELRELLQAELREVYPEMYSRPGGFGGENNPPQPWIDEVYPMENYFVFSYDGDKFRQRFRVSLAKRTVRIIGQPTKVVQKFVKAASKLPMEAAMQLHAGNGTPASLSDGSGPGGGEIARTGSLRSKGKKKLPPWLRKKKMKADGGVSDVGGPKSDTSLVQKKKARGATLSINQIVMKELDAEGANKLHAAFLQATKGKFVGKLQTKSPPGCEHVVKALKKAKVQNPFAVAWWSKRQGRC